MFKALENVPAVTNALRFDARAFEQAHVLAFNIVPLYTAWARSARRFAGALDDSPVFEVNDDGSPMTVRKAIRQGRWGGVELNLFL